jgi:deoxyribodipyrimidine photolyase-related protein
MRTRTLIPILGDQLSPAISSLRGADPSRGVILMCEMHEEATYVRHHRKKIALVLSAMRHFAREMEALGWTVDYVKLDDPENTGSLNAEIERARRRHAIDHVCLTEPGEWRLREALAGYEIREDTRFIYSHARFRQWAEGRRELRMEFFYREMRHETGLLMRDGKPEGGQWNFDAENRKPLKQGVTPPRPFAVEPDAVTREVLDLVARRFPDHFGDLQPFIFPVTRVDAEGAREHFLKTALADFGDYQDAMRSGEPFLFHSLLAPLINLGLLDPLDLCRRAEERYRKGLAPLNAVEGFIRQIIGWREYVRGIYWLKMPEYLDMNALDARRPLPSFYWNGETPMNCIAEVVKQTREQAYAHHIQRLMVTGNFALLAGIDPKDVHEWYLSVYADAYEWVELPNTLGMALHADGGLLGSKPYAASGNYINRMSDYCRSCRFDVKQRTGKDACPFNALYWDFIARHLERFRRNPRMAQICRSWERFDASEQAAIRARAEDIMGALKPWAQPGTRG